MMKLVYILYAFTVWFYAVFALIAFYYLLRTVLHLNTVWAALGGMALLTLFPFLFAFDWLAWSHADDFLGYAMLPLGLNWLLKRWYLRVALLAVMAGLTREVLLVMLIPLLLYDGELSPARRLKYAMRSRPYWLLWRCAVSFR